MKRLRNEIAFLCLCVVLISLMSACSSDTDTQKNGEDSANQNHNAGLPTPSAGAAPSPAPINTGALDRQLFKLVSDTIATEAGEVENPSNASSALTLINQGANVNARNELSDTPLIMAARNGHIRVMQVLLDKATDINAQDDRGMTALHWAAHVGDTSMVRLLLDKKANPNIKDNLDLTPLSNLEGGTDRSKEVLAIIRMLRKSGAKR